MRFDFIEPFILSTLGVLGKLVSCEVTQGAISLVNDKAISEDITIIINMENYPRNGIIVCMNHETARNINETMNGESLDTLTPLGRDALAEFANIIAGNAVSALNELGFDFRVSPPCIDSPASIAHKVSGCEIMQVMLHTACGQITVNAILGEDGNEEMQQQTYSHCR